jgi:hypothetical protein
MPDAVELDVTDPATLRAALARSELLRYELDSISFARI